MAFAIDTADRRRRRALRAVTPLAALLVAALLIWQGSNAAFSAQTDNTNDTWATGNLVLTNNGGGIAYLPTTNQLFNEGNRKPGDSGFKCITVHSGGSLPGVLKLYRSTPVTGTNGPALSAWIDLAIDAQAVSAATNVDATCGGYGGTTTGAIFSGNLNTMPTTYAAAAPINVAGGPNRVVYRIAWTINTNAPNAVQNSSAITNLIWEIN